MSPAWLRAFAGSSVLLAALVVAALVGEASRPHRQLQSQAANPAGAAADGLAGAVVEVQGLLGVERCLTCHFDVGVEVAGQQDPHAELLTAHPPRVHGCVGCHGGQGRALRPEHAHARQGRARLAEGSELRARCALCHVPGSVPETAAVARGVLALAELGCHVCHRLDAARAAADRQGGFGPTLDDAGRLSRATLVHILSEPVQHFGSSTGMPAFAAVLRAQPDAQQGLLDYLSTLRADVPARRAAGDGRAPCIGCHAASPARGLAAHRCAWIRGDAERLRCGRCHDTPPAPAAGPGVGGLAETCLYIDGHRSLCGACHGAALSMAAAQLGGARGGR